MVCIYINHLETIDGTHTQKIDEKGRVFYVDIKSKKTSFMHPYMKKREPTRIEKDLEIQYGPLPKGWEVINFKPEKGDVRLLYINHNLQKTSWIDPRKRKFKE